MFRHEARKGTVAEHGGAWDAAQESTSPSRGWQCGDKFFYEPESVLRVTDQEKQQQQQTAILARYPDMSSSQCSSLQLSKGKRSTKK
jgi:hypothetical protein